MQEIPVYRRIQEILNQRQCTHGRSKERMETSKLFSLGSRLMLISFSLEVLLVQQVSWSEEVTQGNL